MSLDVRVDALLELRLQQLEELALRLARHLNATDRVHVPNLTVHALTESIVVGRVALRGGVLLTMEHGGLDFLT